MPPANKPVNESARLKQIQSYKILDTDFDPDFDDITELASNIFNVPISAVSIVDAERQWFKACTGLDVRETHRDLAFCAYTILDNELLIVENALKDPRFADNALVTGPPNIRFYVGVPLKNSEGYNLGSLCVIDSVPRTPTQEQLDALLILGRQTVSQMERHRALQEALHATQAKSDFLSSMSHELRTPMNSIMGFTQRLLKRLSDSIPERDLDALETVDKNAKHLLALINDILDLSKIESGMMELDKSSFDFCDVISGVCQALLPLAEEKGLSISSNFSENVINTYADRTKITQVITNLLSNAIKYTEEGKISISVSLEESENDKQILLIIKDTGVGISEKDHYRLFKRFTQLDKNEQRRKGGTGLGLAITKEYIEMHGGTICCESAKGEGSTFICKLPILQDTSVDLSDKSKEISEENHTFSILCVDDDPDILKFLRYTFEDEGYSVIAAKNHDEALEAVKSQKPDIICLDICMPEKSGHDVIESLQEIEGASEIPLIVVSAVADLDIAKHQSVTCYLSKPVNTQEILSEVRFALNDSISDVLVIEDCEDTAKLITQSLTDINITPVHAHHGAEALSLLSNESFDAIILDLMMPEMDGFDFLKRLRSESRYQDIPVFIFSAKKLEAEEIDFLKANSEAIITKGKDNTTALIDKMLLKVKSQQMTEGAQHDT